MTEEKHTGVNLDKKSGKYRAYINYKGRQYTLGYYEDQGTAISAREEAEKYIGDGFVDWYNQTYAVPEGLKRHICKGCGCSFAGGPRAYLCDQCKDLTGQHVGDWDVIKKLPPVGRYDYYLCRCKCGTEKSVAGKSLRCKQSLSCGCVSSDRLRSMHAATDPDLTDQQFGELKVKKPVGFNNRGQKLWLCECSCKKDHICTTSDLTSGHTRSCGHIKVQRMADIADCGTNPASIASGKLSSRNTSGIKGVSFDKRSGKWAAEIMFQGVKYRLGLYSDKMEAAKARASAEEELHGNFLKWYADTHPEKWERIIKKENTESEV